MVWTQDELLLLAQAWQESLKEDSSIGGSTSKQKKVPASHLNKLIYDRFVALSGVPSPRHASTVAGRKDILQHSYVFIRAFSDKKENGCGNWFALTKNEQRTLMKTAGGKHVQPIDEQVFLTLDSFLGEEYGADKHGDGSESESSQATESDADKYQRPISLKKRPAAAAKKLENPRRSTRVSGPVRGKSSTSALEQEAGELLTQKEDKLTKSKRRRVTSSKEPSPFDIDVQGVLERQDQTLAGFLEKRAEERTQEHERICQEREADQKFWAAEKAKDRALLRKLFSIE